MTEHRGWIGVDLDGVLAHYTTWYADGRIGAPVPAMLERVKQWLRDGEEVRVFTARVAVLDMHERTRQHQLIASWCVEHVGLVLQVTHMKDMHMRVLYDDRCVQVEPNTGRLVGCEECGVDIHPPPTKPDVT